MGIEKPVDALLGLLMFLEFSSFKLFSPRLSEWTTPKDFLAWIELTYAPFDDLIIEVRKFWKASILFVFYINYKLAKIDIYILFRYAFRFLTRYFSLITYFDKQRIKINSSGLLFELSCPWKNYWGVLGRVYYLNWKNAE